MVQKWAVLKTASKPSTIEVTEPVTAEINKTEPVTGTEATSNPLPTSNVEIENTIENTIEEKRGNSPK